MTITELPGSAPAPTAKDVLPSLAPPRLQPGTRVEVRSRFDSKWARGFEITELIGEQYRLRRLSDGTELPVSFAGADVRPQTSDNRWWF